jgi:hypothetical protein
MEDKDQLEEASKALFNLSEYYHYAFVDGAGAKVLEDLTQLTELSCLSPNRVLDFQAEISPEQLMFIRDIKQMMKHYSENK